MPFFKKKVRQEENENSIPDDILDFLNDADERYIALFETRNIRYLKDYFTNSCARMLSITAANTRGQRYFCSARYRDTRWECTQKNGEEWTVLKTVIYSDIRAAGSMRMKVSQDYQEEWTLMVNDDEVLVSNVHLL